MGEKTIIIDTPGGKERRGKFKNGVIIMSVGVFFILASIGGFLEKEFKLAFTVLICGVGMFIIGKMMVDKSKKRKANVIVGFE